MSVNEDHGGHEGNSRIMTSRLPQTRGPDPEAISDQYLFEVSKTR